MRFSIGKQKLLAGLGIVVRGISMRSTLQVLSGIQLQAHEGYIELQATDMDLGMRATIDVAPDQQGKVVVPGRLLMDVVRSLPGEELSLEYTNPDQGVQVVSGPAKFHLRTLPSEDFPTLPEFSASKAITVPAQAFIDTSARVARAASKDETRPHLTGVLVSVSEQSLRMVATDSYRLSVQTTPLDKPVQHAIEANIPARTLQELSRISSAQDGDELEIAADENQVLFRTDSVVLSSRLVEGRFPNYEQLLPESYEHELRVSRPELLSVVRRISLLAQKNTPLRMRFSDGMVEISAQTPDVGEASETLPVNFQGEQFEIGFNPAFLRDGLESGESDELRLKLISPLRPGLLESGSEGQFMYLIMPIRLNV
jgi:DNA polymerase III subunit beta